MSDTDVPNTESKGNDYIIINKVEKAYTVLKSYLLITEEYKNGNVDT